MVDIDPYADFTYHDEDTTSASPVTIVQQSLDKNLPSNPLEWSNQQFLDQLGGWVKGVSGLVTGLVKSVGEVVGEAEHAHPLNLVKILLPALSKAPNLLEPVTWLVEKEITIERGTITDKHIADARKAWEWVANLSFGSLYRGMLEVGLGLDTTEWPEDAQRAVTTTDTMLGFAFLLPFISVAVDHAGKGLFADRWPESWGENFGKLAEELGLSWALGLQIDKAYETAVGVAQEEAINRQKRGNRIEWPQLRTLFKQHILDDKTINELLQNAGFPDEQITWLKKLQDAQLAISDISQLWYRDEMSDDDAKRNITAMGFSEHNANILFDLYMAKAENQASVSYRTVARQMFVAHIISEEQYRKVLEDAKYPAKLIDQDIAAIQLEQSLGRVIQSVQVIKSLYQHNQISGKEAATRLGLLNYSQSYITDLINTWNLAPIHRSHGLSQSKILSYYVSGILKRESAETQLISLGLDTDSVKMLLDHPTIPPGVRQHARSPGLVVTAYVDGALQHSELHDALKAAGVTDRDIPLYVATAQYRLAHRKGSPNPIQEATTADIKEWQKAGLVDFQHAVTRYEHLGWSPDDALMIAETVNKGPFQPPLPPPFASVSVAIQYLLSRGAKVFAPPDPAYSAAAGMAEAAGYTVDLPAGAFQGTPVGEIIGGTGTAGSNTQ